MIAGCNHHEESKPAAAFELPSRPPTLEPESGLGNAAANIRFDDAFSFTVRGPETSERADVRVKIFTEGEWNSLERDEQDHWGAGFLEKDVILGVSFAIGGTRSVGHAAPFIRDFLALTSFRRRLEEWLLNQTDVHDVTVRVAKNGKVGFRITLDDPTREGGLFEAQLELEAGDL